MKAVILAAGVGQRLAGDGDDPPKALLRFGGRTLLARHIEILRPRGVEEIVVIAGYQAERITAEIARLGAGHFTRTVFNPDFREGSVVSLWTGRDAMRWGGDVLLMDADVLYDPRIMDRLLRSAHRNCFLMDREFEPGDEPVKLCLNDGHPAEFRKKIEGHHEVVGESVGFFRFEAGAAAEVVAAVGRYVAAARRAEPYEEPIRDVLQTAPRGRFGVEDITGLPWIEIDFPEDVRRANDTILPLLPR
ncbi:MAG: phosphocholine cytidylyltransferase family protein [Alphaproteobacteria bacterium]